MDTFKVRAWSKTVVDDSGKLSGWEYNGSFQANWTDIQAVFGSKNEKTAKAWVQMMDCFHVEIMFIRCDDTNEVAQFSNIYPHEVD